MRTRLHLFCIIISLAISSYRLCAQMGADIVTNGGFETGDFSGWTLSSGAYYSGVDNGSYSGIAPYDGSYEAALATPNTICSLSQTLSTTTNAAYLLSFWLNSTGSGLPDELLVSWNGTTIFDQTNISTTSWTNIQILVKTTGTNTILEFGFRTDYEGIILALDDVSVTSIPFLRFSCNPGNGPPPLTVNFTSGAVDNNNVAITKWNWNFGDGSTSAAENPTHVYPTDGDFAPSLIATNINGNTVVGIGPSIAATPFNDNFTNRSFLTGPYIGDNLAATLEKNEPNPGAGIGSVTNTTTNGIVSVLSVTNTLTNSVWWSWTAPTNGPAAVLTLGSSFDTVVDVYTGNALSNLVCVASNLNTVLDDDLYSYSNSQAGDLNPANAGILDRVGFLAQAGTNYQIQVSGLTEGAIDLSLQSVALKILSVNQLATNGDGSVNFSAVVEVGNSGPAASAPLKLELLAHAGYSYDSNNSSPPSTNAATADQVLTNYYLANPSTVAAGAATNLSVSGICPGPIYVNSGGGTNSGFGWGVYAVLEQEVGTNWFFMDNDLLFYGQWPAIGGVIGNSGGVIRLNPSQLVTASNPGYVTWLLGPQAAVLAGAGWRLTNDPVYTTASNYVEVVIATNSLVVKFKSIAGWNLPPSQTVVVLPGQLTTETADYSVTNPILLNESVGLGITGTAGTVYRLDRRTSLTSGSWVPVRTNTLGNGFNLLLPRPNTNGPANYYRAVWLGQ